MRHHRTLVYALGVCLWAAGSLLSSDQPGPSNEPNLTEQQKRDFLLNAKVIASKHTSNGITSPWHLTLSDGKITHDAHFQSVDVRKTSETMSDGRTELNFRDSYHYNIAAYELAKLLGMSDMVPLALERKWNGERGAIAWWVPMKWDEGKRLKQKVQAPDPDAWNKQMYKVRVFDELVYDTDPNLTNVLITEDWKIWRADFSRAFRLYHDLKDPKDLVMCDRQLLEKLRKLDEDELREKTAPHLSKGEVKAVMARRDKIVAYFEKLVAQKGEGAVLY
jgi:hypothetical protein